MIHLEILPSPQRAFWEEDVSVLPAGWVLYGGTAIALHLGHRQSRDFDFFSSDPLDRRQLRRSCSVIERAATVQDEPDTLTVIAEKEGQPIKLSFFGGIPFGRVGEPLRQDGRVPIASLLDLFGTKLATVTQRVDERDYRDIAAILEAGLEINQGVAALLALYANQASAVQSVKTIAWFRDGDLDRLLPADVQQRLIAAAQAYDPRTMAAPKRSTRLD